jgi:spermidine synthase
MSDWVTVERAFTASGSEFDLGSQDEHWVVRVDGRMLMSSKMHHSETELADQAIERADDPRTVLVGGLGLGYTLRAVLDGMPDDAEITVAELVPQIVDWNRTHLAHLNDSPLDDPRCRVVVGDVLDTIRDSPSRFDVILLDVDNGPRALSQAKNQRLYTDAGVRTCRAGLTPGGVLAVWSVGRNQRYVKRLERFGFAVEERKVQARVGSHASHILFLATVVGGDSRSITA